ncbi:MAG TPA: toxin-antitoxin system YwqK family antitoxin [Cyclobacteriaceae bacterium]
MLLVKIISGFFICLLAGKSVFAQKESLENHFKIIEVLKDDSLKIYFDEDGHLMDKGCADFYRVVKLEKNRFVFDGKFRDYDMNDNLVIEGQYLDGKRDGNFLSYYADGSVKGSFNYKNDIRIGEWTYWYPDGKKYKTIEFKHNKPRVIDLWSIKGKKLVKDGKGKFNDTLQLAESANAKVLIRGKVKNGMPHGKWTVVNTDKGSKICDEFFKNGRFIYGVSYSKMFGSSEYKNQEFCKLINFNNDLVRLRFRSKACTGSMAANNARIPEFPGEKGAFSRYLRESLKQIKNKNQNTWILVSLIIKDSGEIIDYDLLNKTSPDIENKFKETIRQMPKWNPTKVVDESAHQVFIPIQILGDEITFPEYAYIP